MLLIVYCEGFRVRLLSFCGVIRFFTSSSQRPMTSKFEGFLAQILSITFLSYLNSSVRASISLFLMLSVKQGNTGTTFITSLVWRGPWLGIEPGTSRIRSQHSTSTLPLGYRGGGCEGFIVSGSFSVVKIGIMVGFQRPN